MKLCPVLDWEGGDARIGHQVAGYDACGADVPRAAGRALPPTAGRFAVTQRHCGRSRKALVRVTPPQDVGPASDFSDCRDLPASSPGPVPTVAHVIAGGRCKPPVHCRRHGLTDWALTLDHRPSCPGSPLAIGRGNHGQGLVATTRAHSFQGLARAYFRRLTRRRWNSKGRLRSNSRVWRGVEGGITICPSQADSYCGPYSRCPSLTSRWRRAPRAVPIGRSTVRATEYRKDNQHLGEYFACIRAIAGAAQERISPRCGKCRCMAGG